MAKNDNLKDFLTDVADAIREKKGTTELINPQDFGSEIRGIESGNAFGETMIDNTGGGVKGFNHVSISEGVTSLATRAYASTNIISANLPNTLTSIGQSAFASCVNLKSIDIPDSVITISQGAFSDCSSLASHIKIPRGVSTLPITIFYYCSKIPYFDFSDHTKVPVLESTNTFGGTIAKFIVPDALYDEWIVAINWATYASRIVKASEFVEPTNE